VTGEAAPAPPSIGAHPDLAARGPEVQAERLAAVVGEGLALDGEPGVARRQAGGLALKKTPVRVPIISSVRRLERLGPAIGLL
jgi:hypothetical protein